MRKFLLSILACSFASIATTQAQVYPTEGRRGMVSGFWGHSDGMDLLVGLNGSLGRQLNPYLFVGGTIGGEMLRWHSTTTEEKTKREIVGYTKIGGVRYPQYRTTGTYTEYHRTDYTNISVPILAHVRTDLIQNTISPFVDVQLGCALSPWEDSKAAFELKTDGGVRFGVFNLFCGLRLNRDKMGSMTAFCAGLGFDFGAR